MKYINHMTCAHLDSKMQELIDQHGLTGYGAYWVIAERIAAQIRPESASTQWTLSWTALARHLGYTRTALVQHLCSTMHTAGLIVLTKRSDKLITIDMPNLLKYADEYSKKVLKKKSGQTPDKLPINSGSPALPAFPALQKEKKDLRQPVDNSEISAFDTGADDGGDCLRHPPVAPTRFEDLNGAGKKIRGINLSPAKEQAVAELYRRHMETRIRGDDLSDALRGAGLDHLEIVKVASLFMGD